MKTFSSYYSLFILYPDCSLSVPGHAFLLERHLLLFSSEKGSLPIDINQTRHIKLLVKTFKAKGSTDRLFRNKNSLVTAACCQQCCLLGEGGRPKSNSDCKIVVVQTAGTIHPGLCITGKMWVEIGLMQSCG